MDERVLAERLITYDTSPPARACARPRASSRAGWSRASSTVDGRRLRRAAGHPGRGRARPRARRSSSTATSTSSPRARASSTPRIEGDRLIGRGAYDMKGALAAMMCALKDVAEQDAGARALRLRPRRGVRGRRRAARPTRSSRRACGPTSRSPASRPTCTSASRPRACSRSACRSRAPPPTARRRGWATTRSSRPTTPSAASRRCPSAASPRTSSTARRSTSRGSWAATPSTRSPTRCTHRRRHPLPAQPGPGRDPRPDPRDRGPRDRQVASCARRPSSRAATRTSCALRDAVGRSIEGEALSIGRDGASDAISFLEAGIPAVEFGPVGGGHHGPHEWVSIASLARYRRALGDFVATCRVARAPGAAVAARRRRRPGVERSADRLPSAKPHEPVPDEKPPRVASACTSASRSAGVLITLLTAGDRRLGGPAGGQRARQRHQGGERRRTSSRASRARSTTSPPASRRRSSCSAPTGASSTSSRTTRRARTR